MGFALFAGLEGVARFVGLAALATLVALVALDGFGAAFSRFGCGSGDAPSTAGVIPRRLRPRLGVRARARPRQPAHRHRDARHGRRWHRGPAKRSPWPPCE